MSRYPRRVRWLAGGDSFTVETLHEMGALAVEGASEPRLVTIARNMLASNGGASVLSLVTLVYDWLTRFYRYKDDPPDAEWLTGVQAQMDQLEEAGFIEGDCDDRAILAAALLRAMGARSGFVVVAKSETGAWVHVLPVAWSGEHAIPFDSQVGSPVGKLPEGAMREMAYELS